MVQRRAAAPCGALVRRLACALVAGTLTSCGDPRGSGPVTVIGTAASRKPIAGSTFTP